MIREKIEDRRCFSINEKIEMLNKTDCRCGRCGKSIGFSVMTVDHAIPISKAGTNNFVNLIPLCKECNKEKGNYVIHPDYFYRYVKEEFMQPLREMYHEYIATVDYMSLNNLFPYDVLDYGTSGGYILDDRKRKVISKSKKRLYIKKSSISELEEVHEAYLKYLRKNGVVLSDQMKDCLLYQLKGWYSNGATYALRNVSGEIVVVLPMRIERVDFGEEGGGEKLSLVIGKVLMMYKKINYIFSLSAFLEKVIKTYISFSERVFTISVFVNFYKFDSVLEDHIGYMLADSNLFVQEGTISDGSKCLIVEGLNSSPKLTFEERYKLWDELKRLSEKDPGGFEKIYPNGDKEVCDELGIPVFDDYLIFGMLDDEKKGYDKIVGNYIKIIQDDE